MTNQEKTNKGEDTKKSSPFSFLRRMQEKQLQAEQAMKKQLEQELFSQKYPPLQPTTTTDGFLVPQSLAKSFSSSSGLAGLAQGWTSSYGSFQVSTPPGMDSNADPAVENAIDEQIKRLKKEGVIKC